MRPDGPVAQDRFLGVLRINLDITQLDLLLGPMNETTRGETALVTPGGELVLCSGREPELLEEYLARGTPKAPLRRSSPSPGTGERCW